MRVGFYWKTSALTLCLMALAAANSLAASDERLRTRLEAQSLEGSPYGEQPLHDVRQLLEFYESRDFERQWTHRDGSLNDTGDHLLTVLSNSRYLGLLPQDYHVDLIQQVSDQEKGSNHGKAIDLELLLTDGLMLYLKHSYQGKVNPREIHADWTMDGRTLNRLNTQQGQFTVEKLEAMLADSEPEHPDYSRLKAYYRQLLERTRDNDIDFPPMTGLLKPGSQSPVLASVRQALSQLGINIKTDGNPESFDEQLKRGLMQFQQHHGLNDDGILGQRTYDLLRKIVNGDTSTVRANLERWRWLPTQIASDYLLVNIADFNLRLVRDNETVLSMSAIVGKPFRMTPVMSEKMRYVVVNPSWSVPYTIASKDLLPKMRSNPDYFRQTGMQVFENWGQNQRTIDPATVDWNKVSARRFPYHLRQPPGPNNPLGRVKFMFPNPHSVYLHDTNDRTLFRKGERGFSSGCVRVSQPIELLYEIFRDHPRITRQSLDEILGQGKETSITLHQPLNVYIQYWTVWIDESGQPVYRNDIYERDARLLKALNESWLNKPQE